MNLCGRCVAFSADGWKFCLTAVADFFAVVDYLCIHILLYIHLFKCTFSACIPVGCR